MCLWSFHIITTRHLSSEGDGRDMGKLSCDHHMIIIVSPSSPPPPAETVLPNMGRCDRFKRAHYRGKNLKGCLVR